jgi:hypothetical protein
MVCRVAFILGLVCGSLGFGSHVRAQALGSWAHPDQAEIRGTVAFTSKSIVQALKKDKALIAAAAQEVPAAEYVALLEQRVREGYLQAGYGQVQVVATVDSAGDGRVVLDIDEGPQFHCGAIVVSGLSPELDEAVRQCIVNRDADVGNSLAKTDSSEPPPFFTFDHRCQQQAEPPAKQKSRRPASGSQQLAEAEPAKKATNDSTSWTPEKPARLDSLQLRQLREQVRSALVDAGYAEAEFELAIAYHDQLADLNIQVTTLGTAATVAEIDVQGNVKDTDEEIIHYTGLQMGEPWTTQRREAVRVRLLEAARYVEPKIDEQITAGQARLTIRITEYPAAPPLSGEASPEEQVCFKYRDWLERGAGYEMDQVLTATSEQLEVSLVLSPHDGLIVEVAIGATEAQRESTRCGLLLTSTELHLYLAQPRWKMCLQNTFAILRLAPRIEVRLNNDGTIGRYISCGANLQDSKPGGPPASTGLTMNIAPLVYRAMAHEYLQRAEWQGDELILWKTTGVIRLEKETGALCEMTAAYNGNEFKFQVVHGAYGARRDQLDATTRDWRTFPDPARRFGSSVEFACAAASRFLEVPFRALDESKQMDRQRWVPRVALAGRLAGLGLLDPIERWWFTPRDPSQKRFVIPSEGGTTSGGMVGSAVTAVKGAADETGAEGEWPAFMLQQTCSLLSGQREAACTTAHEICERYNCGPLACCAGAMLLAKSQKDLSEELAAIGLQRLDRESYLRDCQTLFDPASSIGDVSRCWYGVLAQLTPREIDMIDSYLGDSGMLYRCAQAYQRHATEEDPPLAAASEMWDQWLHDYLKAKLYALRGVDSLMSSPFPLPALQR